jgi:hypothetical protein
MLGVSEILMQMKNDSLRIEFSGHFQCCKFCGKSCLFIRLVLWKQCVGCRNLPSKDNRRFFSLLLLFYQLAGSAAFPFTNGAGRSFIHEFCPSLVRLSFCRLPGNPSVFAGAASRPYHRKCEWKCFAAEQDGKEEVAGVAENPVKLVSESSRRTKNPAGCIQCLVDKRRRSSALFWRLGLPPLASCRLGLH